MTPNCLTERVVRFSGVPPSESGETTQPSSPEPPNNDKHYQELLRAEAYCKSTPLRQFQSQANREYKRLIYQITEKSYGRRQTLPWDNISGLTANSENNVRSRWVEQGIWGEDWRPAWPEESARGGTSRKDGPFADHASCSIYKAPPGARWGHEESDPGFESESETQSEPEPGLEQRSVNVLSPSVGQAKPPKPPPPSFRYTETRMGLVAEPPIPRPKVYKERDWIEDEMNYKARSNVHEAPGKIIDLKTLDAMACASVKENRIEDGIWRSDWDEVPEAKWAHEYPEEEFVMEMLAASDPAKSKSVSESETLGKQGSSEDHPSTRPVGVTEEKESEGRFGRSRSDGFGEQTPKIQRQDVSDGMSPSQLSVSVPSTLGQSKRDRIDHLGDDQQPSKRPYSFLPKHIRG